jgi:hypothetical protein
MGLVAPGCNLYPHPRTVPLLLKGHADWFRPAVSFSGLTGRGIAFDYSVVGSTDYDEDEVSVGESFAIYSGITD